MPKITRFILSSVGIVTLVAVFCWFATSINNSYSLIHTWQLFTLATIGYIVLFDLTALVVVYGIICVLDDVVERR